MEEKTIQKGVDKIFDVQGIEINTSPEKAYKYIADQNNLPRWTNAFKTVTSGRTKLQTPQGEVDIKLEVRKSDEARTVDWHLTFPDGKVGSAYSRVTDGGRDSVVFSFVLMAPPVELERLEGALKEQIEILAEELKKLKSILETN